MLLTLFRFRELSCAALCVVRGSASADESYPAPVHVLHRKMEKGLT